MTFRNRKHIALEDLMFYDNEQLCVEMQAWSDAEDWHYIIPFTVCGDAIPFLRRQSIIFLLA